MKTILIITTLAVVATLLAVPTVAQNPTPNPPPGFYVYWSIDLHSATANGGSGSSLYSIAEPMLRRPPTPGQLKGYTKLSVECEYLTFPDLTPLDVFVGPGTTPGEPFGKLVGTMQVTGGSATFLTARPPVVKKGTTLTVVHNGIAIMVGHF
ncbi:MAG TPA: hypothetical protein VNZ03_16525 [Terriglobales bacterium]|jgi:hypothetical protein|nr:hypothetical protein [Terriglobales bacterium]